MSSQLPKDQNYHVDGCPASVKAKITRFGDAIEDFAFIGTKRPEEREDIIESAQVSRYNLEQTVATVIAQAHDRPSKNDIALHRMKFAIEQMQGHTFYCEDDDGVLRRWHPPSVPADLRNPE